MSLNNNIEKVCSFYVSDFHLAVMILPYVKSALLNKKNVITYLENDLNDNIHSLLPKLNLKTENNKKIKNILWHNTPVLDYFKIEHDLNNKNQNLVLVSGKKEYVENVNKKIDEYMKNNKKQNLKVINCYDVTTLNNDFKDVLHKHDNILNTSGEKHISDIFTEFQNNNIYHNQNII